MDEMLKPCPFCGGEAHIDSDYSSELDHTFWQVWHDCDTNPGPVRHTYGHALGMEISTPWCASEDAAVALWNRRSERTCRNASLDPLDFKCSECGAEDYVDGGTIVWVDGGPQDASYCPHCGCKVVSDDDRR